MLQKSVVALSVAFLSMSSHGIPDAHAQGYPVKPVRLVVPFAPGGGSDTVGRMLGQKLGALFGRQFVIDNRAGAGGRIAAELVAKAPPDGYTLLFATSSVMATAPALYSKLPFDMPKDYAPVALVAYAVHVLITHPSVPATSVKDMIARAPKRGPERSPTPLPARADRRTSQGSSSAPWPESSGYTCLTRGAARQRCLLSRVRPT